MGIIDEIFDKSTSKIHKSNFLMNNIQNLFSFIHIFITFINEPPVE